MFGCYLYHSKCGMFLTQGMTALNGYVWFLPTWFTRHWWHTDKYNRVFNEQVPCSSAEMIDAVQGTFSLNTAFIGRPESHIVGNCTVQAWLNAYIKRIEGQVSESLWSAS